MYLSNAEKEALWLTGYGDALPRVVEQALEQALVRGTYIPGEESLRLRLADALDLEERLAAAVPMEREAEEVAAIEGAGVFTAEQIADSLAFPGGHEGHPGDRERMQLLRQLHNAKPTTEGQEAAKEPPAEQATTEGQEAAKEPPADQWRSPLEIVTEGPEETEGESALAGDEPVVDGVWVATDGEDAAPSAVHPEVEDQDFSSFSKLELVDYAFDMFGVKLKQSESKDRLIAHVQGLVDEANGTEV